MDTMRVPWHRRPHPPAAFAPVCALLGLLSVGLALAGLWYMWLSVPTFAYQVYSFTTRYRQARAG